MRTCCNQDATGERIIVAVVVVVVGDGDGVMVTVVMVVVVVRQIAQGRMVGDDRGDT